jgi:DNA modification methylase
MPLSRQLVDRFIALAAKGSNSAIRTIALEPYCVGFEGDCRDVLVSLPDESVDCIVTSPPYGDQKDYGSEKEIGVGDGSHLAYLESLAGVFRQLYRVAKSGAAMWVVVDTIKRGGETIPLPWELVDRARNCGWRFQDLIVWDKGKSLPWSHKGHFRGVCEFVLLLSKGSMKQFRMDAIRDAEDLSPYWVKYPERYHPLGKAPSDLWHFPIPVQGSWSKSELRHYCPFPSEMVARMVELSTKEGDVVLDPFAGTFSVPTVAAAIGRFGVGIEINKKFVEAFEKTGGDRIREVSKSGRQTKGSLPSLISGLRILKSPRSLYVALSRPDRLGQDARRLISGILVHVTKPRAIANIGAEVSLEILARDRSHVPLLLNEAQRLLEIPPLSKFGLEFSLTVVPPATWLSDDFVGSLPPGRWYCYANGLFNYYKQDIAPKYLGAALRGLAQQVSNKYPPIFSNIERRVESGLS